MAKKKNRHNQDDAEARVSSSVAGEEDETGPRPKMNARHTTPDEDPARWLVAMQEWVKDSGAKICIMFGPGHRRKGGTIKRIPKEESARACSGCRAATPTEREKSQMYVSGTSSASGSGESRDHDRSWHNRAGVERVMGFCKPEETERFGMAPGGEGHDRCQDPAAEVLAGGQPREQTRRLESRINDPRRSGGYPPWT
jgi:polyphosphate kinase 2 (PPK2 family)